jgi:hypothetical protein
MYRHFLLGGRGSCYLSPELLESLRLKQLQPRHEPAKSDIFALGLICVQLATLCNANLLYDLENFSFKNDRLLILLDLIRQTHSAALAELLSSMCAVDESLRPELPTIREFLSPYASDFEKHRLKIISKTMQVSKYLLPEDIHDHSSTTQARAPESVTDRVFSSRTP